MRLGTGMAVRGEGRAAWCGAVETPHAGQPYHMVDDMTRGERHAQVGRAWCGAVGTPAPYPRGAARWGHRRPTDVVRRGGDTRALPTSCGAVGTPAPYQRAAARWGHRRPTHVVQRGGDPACGAALPATCGTCRWRVVPRNSERGFTLVEIALCLAIVAFALVAIIGVMPLGMNVQRDNRADTIINEDGKYWLNAIRGGAAGALDLTNFVYWVNQTNNVPDDSRQIIGLLSTPYVTNRALVRAISGAAVERDSEVGFDYVLFSQILPFADSGPVGANLSSNLYEVRLILRWPALPNGGFGNGKRVFRTLVSGRLVEELDPRYGRLPFFLPQMLEAQP